MRERNAVCLTIVVLAASAVTGGTPDPAVPRGRAANVAESPATAMSARVVETSGAPQPESKPPTEQSHERVFLGADGQRLPFRSDDEALEFLREARVVRTSTAPGGIMGSKKVELDRAGVRANAIFRTMTVQKRMQRLAGGRVEPHFRDHFINEVAAYEVSQLLGLDTVPPVVERKLRGKSGSLQLWIEGTVTEKEFLEGKPAPLVRIKHRLQVCQMWVFDNLIHNIDRNLGNYLTDTRGRVWYVDHTRSFSRSKKLSLPKRVKQCDRAFWARLETLPDQGFVETLRPYLNAGELEALLERRQRLVALIGDRIGRDGSGSVLFDLSYTRARPQEPESH